MGNNKYIYSVSFGYTSGKLSVAAANEDEAQDKILESIGEKLADAFPELDIEYSVECEEVYEDYREPCFD